MTPQLLYNSLRMELPRYRWRYYCSYGIHDRYETISARCGYPIFGSSIVCQLSKEHKIRLSVARIFPRIPYIGVNHKTLVESPSNVAFDDADGRIAAIKISAFDPDAFQIMKEFLNQYAPGFWRSLRLSLRRQ